MSSTAVYTCALASSSVGREAVVFENVGLALAMRGDVERRFVPDAEDGETAGVRTAPGLRQVKSREQIIALGRAAHTILADFTKRTLIASEIDFAGGARLPEQIEDDINRLIWSCINTSKLVALGESAWRSVQMLPLGDACFYGMPPLRLAAATSALTADGVLVINHDADDARARALAALLEKHVGHVTCAGLRTDSSVPACPDPCWSDRAAVHVHVGHHTISAEELRLVDSWYSRRLALQLLPRRKPHHLTPNGVLMIEDEVNGFVCHTPEKIAACWEELRSDRVLQGKMIDAGVLTVAPLALKWMAIADDLLAG